MLARNPDPAVTARRAALGVIALVALAGAGCSKKIVSALIPNQPPEVRLTAAPVARDSLRPDFYSYTMQWVGFDPDGRVDHFLLAVDPARPEIYDATDTTWHATANNESTFFFSAGKDYDQIPQSPRGQAPHVISIFAVDNNGAISKQPATRAFFSFTQCPTVQIEEPRPNSAYVPNVTPTVTFRWNGQDPDGLFTVKPVRWVFRLFGQKNPDKPAISDYISYALANPDSVREFYAPDFVGWNTTSADTTSFQFRNLNPSSNYLFVLTGFDEAGAYDPMFTNGRNMLKFGVIFAGTSGPLIRMFNQFFDYTYPSPGYDPSDARCFALEVPSDLPITINWSATPPQGADIRRFRWVMDLVDLSDQTPRSNEQTDWYHWSVWSRNTTSANIGPFLNNREEHRFFLEAEDNNGLVSLGQVCLTVVKSTFERELLFVDDTRFSPDFRSTPDVVVDPPTGNWPTQAELDTFLFARGGFPWRGYPAGTLSPPGIFNGYAFDTVGTRGTTADGTVPLALLGLYRHIVWYTDEDAANHTQPPSDRTFPITALRLGNSPGRPAALSTYLTQGFLTNGGHVWLSGGGAAYATMVSWNKPNTSPAEYTALEPNPELRPGRLMYDFAHWREGIQMLSATSLRRFGSTAFGLGTNRPGRHWPSVHTPPTPEFPPNYALLPISLDPKISATDPLPPIRVNQNPSFFYRTSFRAEYIHRVTFIREDYNDDPDLLEEYSTLDTLYITRGGTALANAPAMTYYHGRENQPLVFQGFNFWYWRRTQCIQLVDWVLQSVWGLPRDPGASRSASVPAAGRRASR